LFYKSAPKSAAGRPENREAELLARDFSELNTLISRREEWMASQCLFEGKVTCLDGDTQEVVAELTYGTPSKTVPAKAWSDPASDPLSDLRGAMRLVANQSGASADLVVMGQLTADAFESNPNVLNAYDKQRINQGQLTSQNLSWGVQSLGTYRGVCSMSTKPNTRTSTT
jgi:Phage major capsid protein E